MRIRRSPAIFGYDLNRQVSS